MDRDQITHDMALVLAARPERVTDPAEAERILRAKHFDVETAGLDTIRAAIAASEAIRQRLLAARAH